MRSGRELDALVAEKLFNLSLRDRLTGEEKPVTATQVLSHFSNISAIPPFSTDIAAAWQVLEKVVSRSRLFDADVSTADGGETWSCSFTCDKTVRAFGETAAHAICLAALKTVEA